MAYWFPIKMKAKVVRELVPEERNMHLALD